MTNLLFLDIIGIFDDVVVVALVVVAAVLDGVFFLDSIPLGGPDLLGVTDAICPYRGV